MECLKSAVVSNLTLFLALQSLPGRSPSTNGFLRRMFTSRAEAVLTSQTPLMQRRTSLLLVSCQTFKLRRRNARP